ncbi:serine/threonine-protein kinase [Kitasatospora sp. NPDC059327]|uniref:serine/threonine-protein kinase n=1 Tax=Kitasatospora sp. NPDC059327 TaxID=3346803 RepID=UPI0036D164AE
MTRADARAVGDVVAGRFELRERLGAGGMGTVWRAHDSGLERDVALKEIRSGGHDDPERTAHLRERALREAKALARINHPNAVAIYEVVDDRPHPWLVMELVDGTPLDALLRDGALTPVHAARIGLDVLAALRAAHTAGILHRDVKPANVLVRPAGGAVLTDFGIAALQGSHTLTATGDLIGSPEYLAPELIRRAGNTVGPPSDLWSLGVLLYTCVEGVNPMRRDSVWEVLVAVCDEPVPSPPHAGPLAAVITALLDRVPDARPDAEETARALAAVRDGQPYLLAAGATVVREEESTRRPPSAPGTEPVATALLPEGTGAPAGVRPRRRPPRAAIAVAGVAALAAAGIGGYAALPGSGAAATGPGGATPPVTGTAAPAPTASGLWIAQLSAVPHGSDRAALDKELLALQRQLPGARILNSDDWKSLNPGYWVVYTTGDFPDGDGALAFCAAHGRSKCVGRYLSQDPTDGRFICVAAPGSDRSGGREACHRP